MKSNKFNASAIMVIAFAIAPLFTFAQGFTPGKGLAQINAGGNIGYANGVYLGLDFGVSKFITIGPRVGFGKTSDIVNTTEWLPSLRMDYHVGGHINALPENLDFYAGASVGYYMWTIDNDDAIDPENSVEYWLQVGSRYYFNETFAVNLEFNPGTIKPSGLLGGYLALGATIKL